MDLNKFQRKAVLLIFISVLAGSIMLSRKEPMGQGNVVIKKVECVPAPEKDAVPYTKADINTADIDTLTAVPGIGRNTAEEIIKRRPFKSADDILDVPGIGEKRLEKIKGSLDIPGGKEEEAKEKQKTDINKAGIKELTAVTGIGAKLAQAIIDYREKHGGIKSMDELTDIPRIGEKILAVLRKYFFAEEKGARTENKEAVEEKEKKTGTDENTNKGTGFIKPKRASEIDLTAKCPYCGKQLWEKGKRKKAYVRCPHCLKLLAK